MSCKLLASAFAGALVLAFSTFSASAQTAAEKPKMAPKPMTKTMHHAKRHTMHHHVMHHRHHHMMHHHHVMHHHAMTHHHVMKHHTMKPKAKMPEKH